MKIMERFWRWLYKRADLGVREHYMRRVKHDRRCPTCGRWGAHHGWSAGVHPHPMYSRLICNACLSTSDWFEGDMMPLLVTRDFQPALNPHHLVAWELRS